MLVPIQGGRVAILAGGGELPLAIAASVVARGGHVHMVAIEGEAGPDVTAYPHTWVNLGAARRMMSALKGPSDAPQPNVMIIAGAVSRPDLFKLRPDWGLVSLLAQALRLITAGGDDALLTRAIGIFERQGLTVVGVHDLAPELLIPSGALGVRTADAGALHDIATAAAVLRALGGLDVGQGVVVSDGHVLAIEGVEGTDRMLTRVAALVGTSGGILYKAVKPGQERRVDLPTIGARTVSNAIAARLHGIAIVAGETLALQRQLMTETADAAGLFVCGVAQAPPSPPTAVAEPPPWRLIGGCRARAADLEDARQCAKAVMRLAAFKTGEAAIAVRGHVLAVSAAEGPLAMLERVPSLGQWGLRRLSGRRGALVIRCQPSPDLRLLAACFAAARKARLAGVGLLISGATAEIGAEISGMADAASLFIVVAACQIAGD
jgi:UDP-2,3-diacylglucosamine hydrolase